jgi:hypothetical protein
MKQTAVEWLVMKWTTQGTLHSSDITHALEMQKEQILNTWSAATNPDYEIRFCDMFYILEQEKKAQQYYNETFNTKEK